MLDIISIFLVRCLGWIVSYVEKNDPFLHPGIEKIVLTWLVLHPGSCRSMPWGDLYSCTTENYLSARVSHLWFALIAQLILNFGFLNLGNTL